MSRMASPRTTNSSLEIFYIAALGYVSEAARGAVAKSLVQLLLIAEVEVGRNVVPCLRHPLVSLQVHFLVFEVAPEPFDEDIIAEPPTSVHADSSSVNAEHSMKSSPVNWLP